MRKVFKSVRIEFVPQTVIIKQLYDFRYDMNRPPRELLYTELLISWTGGETETQSLPLPRPAHPPRGLRPSLPGTQGQGPRAAPRLSNGKRSHGLRPISKHESLRGHEVCPLAAPDPTHMPPNPPSSPSCPSPAPERADRE